MERRRFLERFGLAAAAGAVAAAPTTAEAQTSANPDRNSFRAADFGAVGNGSGDDAPALQRAIDAAHSLGGGTVHLEGSRGRNFRCSSQLSLDGRRGVRVVGSSGPNVSGDSRTPVAQLIYGGVSAPFVSLRSSTSVSFDGVTIGYANPAFRGPLVATGHSSELKADPSHLLFDRCRFLGVGPARSAESLLELGLTICSTVRNCEFQLAHAGIIGGPRKGIYSNVIQITGCVFRDLNEVGIKNAGESWLISNCTFEPLINGRAGAFYQGADAVAYGLVIIGCWMGDVSRSGGCWIDLSQGVALGLSIIGNRMAPPGPGKMDTDIKIGKGNQGVSITGNRIEGPVGIDFTAGYTFGAVITANDLQCTTPIANIQNVMGHFVAGQYATTNKLSGRTTVELATFTGDGDRGPINLVPQTFGPPAHPQDGDLWVTPGGLFVRLNGVTRKVAVS